MTDITTWRKQLLREIEQMGIVRQPRQILLTHDVPAIVGRVAVAEQSVDIAIDIDPLWYQRLPRFILQPNDALGCIPHVNADGSICFLEMEGMIFDWRRPLDVIQACFMHVQRTLQEGVTGTNRQDFVHEFEVYWARLSPSLGALANLDLFTLDHVTEVFVGINDHARSILYITHAAEQIRHMPMAHPARGPWTTHRALYLPLEPDTLLLPPQTEPPFWGNDGVQRLLTHCSPEHREQLETLLRKRSGTHPYLLLRLPRPAGDAALFGVRFDQLHEHHPLVNANTAGAVTPITVFRRDRSYLVQRGGGQESFAAKRVLLLGCGAVGGQIAVELSRAGVEHLHLVDPDKLEPENTYRHVLGKRAWGQEKAVALAHTLRAQIPFSQTTSLVGTIEQCMAASTVDVGTYDLIISAMGNPTSELALNEQVRCMREGPPLIVTWVDPYGIGGHAVLTGVSNRPGCFECLYGPSDSETHLQNRASFAAPDQVFRRTLAGCQNLYTPYGSLDAAQTAQLATRLALDTLLGRAQDNRIRSWKGDSTAFTAAGFTLAPRYHLSLDQLEQHETTFARDTCPICRAHQEQC